jgi:outer membrane lipoprotein carrier protein
MGVLAPSGSVVAQDAGASGADATTDKVQAFYQNIADYQSNFVQVYTDVAAGEETETGGKVFFKKPGKMRWDYYEKKDGKTTIKKVLVSDGKEFNIYEAEFSQYYRRCLGDSRLPTAISFLMGTGDLKTDFDSKLLPTKSGTSLTLELTPKKSSGKYKRIVFTVDATTFAVTRTTVYDPYGNTNQITFLKSAINKKLPDAGFVFPPPKGARILGGGNELKCE